MAISEVCMYEVKREIDECVSKGMSRSKASQWLAGVLTDELGREINPETIRKKDQRARKKFGTNVPTYGTDDWPKCKKCKKSPVKQSNKWIPAGERGEDGGEIYVSPPAMHGLCKWCRQKELRNQQSEERAKQLEQEQANFDNTPVDPDSDRFWSELSDKILEPLSNGGIPCGKVSGEVLTKINNWFAPLLESARDVSKNSTRPGT
jgi:hypothetical protein